MSGLIGKKIGMTNMFDDNGRNVAVTVIEVQPCVITQLKTEENDGYQAVQLGAFDKKEKSTSQQLQGHFEKAGTSPKKYVTEFRVFVPKVLILVMNLRLMMCLTLGDTC
ncbi:MAG: hypothetical protein U5K69_04820 [Balneolaceae bacterium]|nr:hypothetical protein [Balneolaceae bacterium]